MKKQFAKWSLRITVTCLFILALLVCIVLNPIQLYAHKTEEGRYTIYHEQALDRSFTDRLDAANKLLEKSELYNPGIRLSVCLDDGSLYPRLLEKIGGKAFGYGFKNIVTLNGNMNAPDNWIEINGYKWNLTELLAHEATHCLQFYKYGVLHSNPAARLPGWKWEGYPEYVARRGKADLVCNISHLLETEKTDNDNWIDFDDSTGTTIPYYKSWLLVQYCLDIKKMNYDQILKDTMGEAVVAREMMEWYKQRSESGM